jgi:hypothetical protein
MNVQTANPAYVPPTLLGPALPRAEEDVSGKGVFDEPPPPPRAFLVTRSAPIPRARARVRAEKY